MADDEAAQGQKAAREGEHAHSPKQDGDSSEQEQGKREDPFARAIQDPLGGLLGGVGGLGAAQAFRTGINTLRAERSFMPMTGNTFRDLIVTAPTVHARDRQGHAPGPVRPSLLAELRDRYAPVTGYGALVDRLSADRLLVLRGAPGTGRTTTGLRLLDEVAEGRVSRCTPETDIRNMDGLLEEGFGYLYDMAACATDAPTDVHLDRLCGMLAEQHCHLVVVTAHDTRYDVAFAEYAAECPLPDPSDMLDRLLAWEGREQPDLARTLRPTAAVADLKPVREFLRLPSETRWFAHLLTIHAQGQIDLSEVATRTTNSLARHVADWFAPLAMLPPTAEGDDQVRRTSFRLALAIFDKTPFHIAAEAGELLAWEILLARSPRRTPGRPVFTDSRADHVGNSGARLYEDTAEFGDTRVPATFAAYEDDRMPTAVLRHAWNMHNLRGPLIRWLRQLSQDARPLVWIRAALAVGALCAWDFSYTFHELIDPLATAPDDVPDHVRRRVVAAIALGHAARAPEMEPVVRHIVDEWCGSDDAAERWTGATALGYGMGLRDTTKAVEDLRTIGCRTEDDSDDEQSQADVASWAMAELFCRGGVEPMAAAVLRWLEDDRVDVRFLGTLAAARIAGRMVSDLDDLDLTRSPGDGRWELLPSRRRWPLLVALADEAPKLAELLVDLVWRLTRITMAHEVVLETLATWMRAAQKDATCTAPVARFLAGLGDDETDRARLLYLVHELRSDRYDPLPSDIADEYTYAITIGSPRDDQTKELTP